MEHGAADEHGETIYPLEWVTLAMDAAKRASQGEDTGKFRLDFSQLYSDKLAGL